MSEPLRRLVIGWMTAFRVHAPRGADEGRDARSKPAPVAPRRAFRRLFDALSPRRSLTAMERPFTVEIPRPHGRYDMSDSNEFVDLSGEDLDEEFGYRNVDWDALPEKEQTEHDAIRESSLADLDQLDVRSLNDLSKWAAAQAYADFEEDEKFLKIVRLLINSEDRHPAIDYEEISIELLSDLILEGRPDEAEELLDRVVELCDPDLEIGARYSAMIKIRKGDVDGGMATVQQLIDANQDHTLLLLAVAEDLIGVEAFEPATSVLDRVQFLAEEEGDDEVLAAVEDAREFIASIDASEA